MSADETNSLADQAAAWVPPWARQPSPAESDASPAVDPAPEEPPAEVDGTSPEPGPVEAAPLEGGPVEAASAEAERIESAGGPVEAASAEAERVESAGGPADAASLEGGPVEAASPAALPQEAERVDAEPSLDAAVVDVQVDAASPDAEPDGGDRFLEPESGLAVLAGDEPIATVSHIDTLAADEPEKDTSIPGEPSLEGPAGDEASVEAVTESQVGSDPVVEPLETGGTPTDAPVGYEPDSPDETDETDESEISDGGGIVDQAAGEGPGVGESGVAESGVAESGVAESGVAESGVAEIPDAADGSLAADAAFGDDSTVHESIAAEVGSGSDAAGEQTELPIDQEPKVELSDDELRGAVEAILLIVDEPATEIVLAQVLDQPVDRIAAVLERCAREYAEMGRGFELRRVAGGWRLYTRAEYAAYVEKFVLDGQQVRLTQAALETLAVVAYKQPVTRSRISAIRGVNCDGVVRTLVARGLIEECGSEPESGAFLYRTTILFLEKLGLDSVEQLPPLAPFLPDDVDEIADAQR